MKTLVVGGAGFVGQHVTSILYNSGRDVWVAGVRKACDVALLKGVHYIEVRGINDYKFDQLDASFDEIVDLAYASAPKSSYENPVKDICDNLPRFVSLLEFATINCCKKFVFFSTGGAVYGHADFLPITEDHPLNPVSPYGITKLASEKYAQMYGSQKHLPYICLRPGNVYGEGQVPFRGQGIIATIMGCILNKRPLTLFGADNIIRDYIHVDDTAKSVLAALEHGRIGSTYNVGSGVGVGNLRLLDLVEESLPRGFSMPNIEQLPERDFDVRQNVLDASRLISDTGWRPEVSMQVGLKKTFDWLRTKWFR